jgi:hypothetical protein
MSGPFSQLPQYFKEQVNFHRVAITHEVIGITCGSAPFSSRSPFRFVSGRRSSPSHGSVTHDALTDRGAVDGGENVVG